jgi:hypothetical protein
VPPGPQLRRLCHTSTIIYAIVFYIVNSGVTSGILKVGPNGERVERKSIGGLGRSPQWGPEGQSPWWGLPYSTAGWQVSARKVERYYAVVAKKNISACLECMHEHPPST